MGNPRQDMMAEGNKIGNGMNSSTWNRLPGEGLASKGMIQEGRQPGTASRWENQWVRAVVTPFSWMGQ